MLHRVRTGSTTDAEDNIAEQCVPAAHGRGLIPAPCVAQTGDDETCPTVSPHRAARHFNLVARVAPPAWTFSESRRQLEPRVPTTRQRDCPETLRSVSGRPGCVLEEAVYETLAPLQRRAGTFRVRNPCPQSTSHECRGQRVLRRSRGRADRLRARLDDRARPGVALDATQTWRVAGDRLKRLDVDSLGPLRAGLGVE